MDSSVIQLLIDGLERDTENQNLRSHLIALLDQAQRWQEVLDHCKQLLARVPDHLIALETGARAAEQLGQRDLAAAYRRLHQALGGVAAVSPNAVPAKPAAPKIPAPGPFATRSESDQPQSDDDDPGREADDSADPQPAANASLHPFRLLRGGSDQIDPDGLEQHVDVTLADVVGMEHVKHRLDIAFLAPMRNPEMRRLYGKSLRGGLMLYGPPGCGKTFIAKATAGELGARFISIGLSDVMDMYVGQSERNLHEIFENARRKSPCVLFFDELDALGRKRSLRRNGADRDIVNQLLSEMDGANHQNDGVFVLAATNHPWDVDEALRRPGRLDRTLLVLPPDDAARQHLVQFAMQDRPQENIDIPWIVNKTADFSCADIVHLCDSAAEQAMGDSIRSGNVRPICQKDFQKAIKDVRLSTRAWFESARNYALFANDGGAYDELLDYLRKKRLV